MSGEKPEHFQCLYLGIPVASGGMSQPHAVIWIPGHEVGRVHVRACRQPASSIKLRSRRNWPLLRVDKVGSNALTLVTRTYTAFLGSLKAETAASCFCDLCFTRTLMTLKPKTIMRTLTSHEIEGQSQKMITLRRFMLAISCTSV